MTIIGVILSFRQLAQEALNDVLQDRIPFLLSSVKDFHHHVPSEQDTQLLASIRTQIVNEMATAAGLPAKVDPALCTALRAQKMGKASHMFHMAYCTLVLAPYISKSFVVGCHHICFGVYDSDLL